MGLGKGKSSNEKCHIESALNNNAEKIEQIHTMITAMFLLTEKKKNSECSNLRKIARANDGGGG